MLLEKYKPLIEEQEDRKKRLQRIYTINYILSIFMGLSSISILLLNLFTKSDFQMRLIVGITQSGFGLIIAGLLVYLIYYRNNKIILAYNIMTAVIGIVYDSFILFLIIQYSKNDSNYSQAQIDLKDVIVGLILTIIQTLSMYASIYLLIKMRSIRKLCKKFYQNNDYQVSLQEEQKISTPSSSPQPKPKLFIVDKDINKEVEGDSRNQIDFFENCSQYPDSVISDIENSLPSKKKKTLKSIDALQNTDSDAANQKSQATKSERNNSHSHHLGNGKYMSYQKNNQICENEEEEYDDDQEVQVHCKILTPGYQENIRNRDKSSSTPKNYKIKSKNTPQSQSYYNTTIDLAHNS